MTYSVMFSAEAKKQLGKLDNHLRERIISVIERCKVNPYSHITKVIGTKYFRARAGDYRIILEIENNQLLILVIKIGKRENIYD